MSVIYLYAGCCSMQTVFYIHFVLSLVLSFCKKKSCGNWSCGGQRWPSLRELWRKWCPRDGHKRAGTASLRVPIDWSGIKIFKCYKSMFIDFACSASRRGLKSHTPGLSLSLSRSRIRSSSRRNNLSAWTSPGRRSVAPGPPRSTENK